MATLTIRNLDDSIKHALRKRAAEHGVSMEEEVRQTLARSVGEGGETTAPYQRRKPSVEEILALGRRPDKPFDQKKEFDELWSFIEEE